MKRFATAAVLVAAVASGPVYAQSWWSKHSNQPTPAAQTQQPLTQPATAAVVPQVLTGAPPAPQAAAPASAPSAPSAPSAASNDPARIVLLPGDISKPYDILGNVEAEVKGRDSEAQVKAALQQKAIAAYGPKADAIIFFKAEMRVANILAGYALKGGFKWVATGVAVDFK